MPRGPSFSAPLASLPGEPDYGVQAPAHIEVTGGEVALKLLMLAGVCLCVGALPWLLRNARATHLRAFRAGATYAIMPALVSGAGLGSALSGISLATMRYGRLSEFWPLPLAIVTLALAAQALGGALGVLLMPASEGRPASEVLRS